MSTEGSERQDTYRDLTNTIVDSGWIDISETHRINNFPNARTFRHPEIVGLSVTLLHTGDEIAPESLSESIRRKLDTTRQDS